MGDELTPEELRHWTQELLTRSGYQQATVILMRRCDRRMTWEQDPGRWVVSASPLSGDYTFYQTLTDALKAINRQHPFVCECSPARILAWEISQALEKEP